MAQRAGGTALQRCPSSSERANQSDLPIRKRSTPRAARPSAIAQTISDWPRCMSPAVKTPGTLVIQLASRHTLRSVSLTPKFSSSPGVRGREIPSQAARGRRPFQTRCSASSNDIRPSLHASSTFEPWSFLTRPSASPLKRCVDTEYTLAPLFMRRRHAKRWAIAAMGCRPRACPAASEAARTDARTARPGDARCRDSRRLYRRRR